MSKFIDASGIIRRPRLEARLAEASARRMTMVIAGPGFGKTTLLTQVFGQGRSIWHTATPGDSSAAGFARAVVEKMRLAVPGVSGDLLVAVEGGGGTEEPGSAGRLDAVAAALAQDLASHVDRDIVLIVDEVHELGAEAARFLASLSRHASPRLHLVTASREPLPFPTARMRVSGEADRIDERDLAFDSAEVAELLADRIGHEDEKLASSIHARTSGWPVAVIYAAEAMGRGGKIDLELALRGDALMAYLAEEVVSREDPGLVEALGLVAPLPWLTPELLGHLAEGNARVAALDPARHVGHLLDEVPGVAHAVAVAPVIQAFAAGRIPPESVDQVVSAAADWYERGGYLAEALTCHLRLEDTALGAGLLRRRGEEMVARGLGRQVAELISRLDVGTDLEIILLDAEVHQLLGDWEGAMAAYGKLAAPGEPMPARIAWRLGLVHHMRGNVSAAIETYRLGRLEGADPADGAALCAWLASAYWLRGDLEEAAELAARALDLAQETEASRSLAAAHTVLAMVAALRGDRAANDTHYLRALDHAERARDVVQTIRIRSNRGSHFLEEGDYPSALAEIEIALRLADMTGFELWRGMALANRGEVVARMGSLEEAIADLTQARRVFRRIGSRLEAYPLAQLGDVYATRGDRSLARSCYEQALEMLDDGDLQGLVPALCGLARLLAADDNERARLLATRATEVDSVIGRSLALVTMGWVEHVAGEHARAGDRAADAAAVARLRHDHAGLAAALELQAVAGGTGGDIVLLEEARSVWKELGASVDVARVDAMIGASRGGTEGAALATIAAELLARLGAKGPALEARAVADHLASGADEGVRVATLGGFAVVVDGSAVPVSAWQSKVARDVLAMLVANRGKAVHREVLMDRLWPEDDPTKAANRLSVALTTIRNVLDPGRARSSGLVTDRDTVALDLRAVAVDVDEFLATARRGLSMLRIGEGPDHALAVLRSAEGMYVGDFLEDHPYDEWAIPLREEARSVFVRIATVLADADTDIDDHDGAARRHLRILERDPYNERSHLRLVEAMLAAGRHGTARRLYGSYASRMAELEVEPEPYPG